MKKGLGYRCMQLGEMPWGFFSCEKVGVPNILYKAEKVTVKYASLSSRKKNNSL